MKAAPTLRRVNHRSSTRSPTTGRTQRLPLAVWWLIVPFLAFFAVSYLVPIGYTIVTSLYSRRSSGGLGLGPPRNVFTGAANYIRVLTSADFWAGMGRVLLYGVVQVPVMLTSALVLALLLDAMLSKAKRLYQLSYFLPYAVPGVIASLLWAYLYVPQLSPIVHGLRAIGLDVNFLGPRIQLWSMANITTWSWTGYSMIIIVAALQAIPRDQYEAARIDGANERQIAIHIKIPSVRNAIGLTILMSIIGTIQLFNEPTIVRTVSDNISSHYVPMMMAYDTAFTSGDTGYAGAIAMVMAVVAGVLVYGYYLLTKRVAR